MMKPQSFLIAIALVLVGCGKPEPKASTTQNAPAVKVTAENQRSLFPFVEGNSWDFVVDVQQDVQGRPKSSATGQIQYKVKKAVNNPDGSVRATIVVTQNGKFQDEQEWSCDNNGIFQLSMKSTKDVFTPKQPVIRFPVKDQDKFKWEGTGITPIGKPGKMTYAFLNDGVQSSVDTDMGTMSALFMQTGGSFKTNDGIAGQLVVNAWFTPGVGLVRYKQVIAVKGMNSSITLRLKSYNVKK